MEKEKAIRLLSKCEEDLRTLVAVAADTGDYDAVLTITSWAKQLRGMTASDAITTVKQSTEYPRRNSASRTGYPRFARRGDQLVKFGWSKREKAEYEHRAPLDTALTLASAAAEKGRDGRIFQIANLAPWTESSIPEYQMYLVVAWWRSAALLDQHGRQGYSIPKAGHFRQSVETAWTNLPEE